MLGPSIMFVGTALALGVSIHALARTPDRSFAITALALSSMEALFLAFVSIPNVMY